MAPALHTATIEQVLQQNEATTTFLTASDRAGGWRRAFGDAASSVPEPYWLFSEDEQTPLVLGFPLTVSSAWESFCRDLARLVESETLYRCALLLEEPTSKPALVEQRYAVAHRLAELTENALLHDHGRRLPGILLFAVSNEMADNLRAASRTIFTRAPKLPARTADEVRYAVAQRLADITHRAEQEAVSRLQRWGVAEPRPATLSFTRQLLADLLPIAEARIGPDLKELDAYLQGYFKVDPARFHKLLSASATQLDGVRRRDPSFDRVLKLLDPDSAGAPSRQLFFAPSALDLIASWGHADMPRLSTDMIRLLQDLTGRLKRFEVITSLRARLYPVTTRGVRAATRLLGQFVRLSTFTRPLDFTAVGVVESTVRRYGLVYDLVEFTQINEELRRRGRGTEENALRFMVRFQDQVDDIRSRYRLKFEKFLGDGAFYSARSAKSVLLGAAEIRILYERLRHQGFPFDRGLRLAINVGTYHLLPMGADADERTRFEFFGHGLVELARLTTGKTALEVEDIADFLIASGYDVHRVLDFLEPVRHGSRFPDHVRERPYAAYLSENEELVNLGGVATEGFLRDLEAEWTGPIAVVERFGLRWLLLPLDSNRLEGPWLGLRALGTARLKGLEPTPLAETVVFEEPPEGLSILPEGSFLVQTLQELAGRTDQPLEPEVLARAVTPDPSLCVVSTLEAEQARLWYIGQYREEVDALLHAFTIPLQTVDLLDGEPFEAWLFRRRGELAMLYQGLCRDSTGTSVPLDTLRSREGYFTCLLTAPLRSPR
ncbi:MAG: hypothetical protein ACM3O7_12395 [Acidobacteriota bacterium]